MSTRSHVGIAIHKDINLTEEVKEYLSDADQVIKHEQGTLYVFEDIKWSSEAGTYASQDALMDFLHVQEGDKWRLVEACHDYPASSTDEGGWVDNPFKLARIITTELTWIQGAQED